MAHGPDMNFPPETPSVERVLLELILTPGTAHAPVVSQTRRQAMVEYLSETSACAHPVYTKMAMVNVLRRYAPKMSTSNQTRVLPALWERRTLRATTQAVPTRPVTIPIVNIPRRLGVIAV